MDAEIIAQNLTLNQCYKRMNEQYHAYAVHCGLSDPALWVLYSLWETETPLTQNDLCALWMYPKQTINFTITGLVKKGYVRLEQRPGARSGKAVQLTAEGKALCQAVIAPLMETEERSLSQLSAEDRALLVTLSEKQCLFFEQEMQAFLQSAPPANQ
mgnify:CR=1 FL=1